MTAAPKRLTIASRGSRLALAQAGIVARLIEKLHPGMQVEVVRVTTRGDRDERPFGAIGGKGLFTSEVEREVAERRADVAVHSAKDLTAELAPGCALVCVPPRASVGDVVVGGDGSSGAARIASLPAGARVGTSSMRRRALLAEARADLDVAELRGNLDTRLAKVQRGEVYAAVVAAAGLERIGRDDLVASALLDPTEWIPAPSQGALAVEALEDRRDLVELFAPLADPGAAAEVACERAFAARLEGGCSVPLGCTARADEDRLLVRGLLASPRGDVTLRDRVSGPLDRAEALGIELAQALLRAGGDHILAEIDRAGVVAPSPP
jgi:hydroxymethylbilane synthase